MRLPIPSGALSEGPAKPSDKRDDSPPPVLRSDVRPTIRAGLVVLAVTVLGFGLWAGLTPLASGIHAMGQVVVETNRKTVDHLEGGIVKEILVQEGLKVRKGDPLIVLQGTQTRANREIGFARYILGRLAEVRLLAERSGSEQFVLPADLARYAADERVKAVMRDQMRLLQERRRQNLEQVSVQRHRMEQARQQASGIEANLNSNAAQLALAERENAAVQTLLSQGFATATQARSAEREFLRLQGEARSLEAERRRVAALEAEAHQQLEVVQAGYRREVSEQLDSVGASMRESSEQFAAAEDAERRSVIRAPQEGQVVGLAVHTVGGVVTAGAPLMYIVPEHEKLLIEGQIRPLDAAYVHRGMPAEVKFIGLPKRTSPLLRGHLLTVSNDTLSEPKGGLSYYLIRVEIQADQMRRLGDAVVTPGMPVELLLEADKRTVLEYLVAPWSDLFRKAMREY